MVRPRFYHRRRAKRILAWIGSLLALAATVWVSVRLATPPLERSVHVVGSPSPSPSPQYTPSPGGDSIIVHQPGTAQQPDLEIRGTDQGLLIRPANPHP